MTTGRSCKNCWGRSAAARSGMFMSLIKTVLPGWGSGILKLFFLPMGQPLLQYGMKKKKNPVQEELVEDITSLIASFSGQLYGMRSKKNAGG